MTSINSGLCSFFKYSFPVFSTPSVYLIMGELLKTRSCAADKKTSLLLFIVVCVHAKQITLWATVGVFISKITSQRGQSSSSMEINEVAAWCCYKKSK